MLPEAGILTAMFACIPMLFGLAVLVGMFFVVRLIFHTFFNKAKEVYTDASKAALSEHGYQEGIAALNRRLAAGEIDEGEYQRLRKIIESQGRA